MEQKHTRTRLTWPSPVTMRCVDAVPWCNTIVAAPLAGSHLKQVDKNYHL